MAGMSHHVHIDPAKFLASFEYKGTDGSMKTVEPWRFGERIANLNEEQKADFREAWGIVDNQMRNTRIFIPSQGQHAINHEEDNTFDKLQVARGESEQSQSYYKVSNKKSNQIEFTESFDRKAKTKSNAMKRKNTGGGKGSGKKPRKNGM